MALHMVRHTVKPGRSADNEELLNAVFAELHEAQPNGVRYAAFKLPDDLTFVHLIGTDAKDGQLPRVALSAFHAGIRERCDQAPTRTKLSRSGTTACSGRTSGRDSTISTREYVWSVGAASLTILQSVGYWSLRKMGA